MGDLDRITNSYLLYFLLPGWIVPGLADWACHRRSRIEHTSGTREAVLHLVMITTIGVPILMALLLEINALVILLMLVAFAAHQAMALWDVSYAVTKRTVTPVEQHVHSFLEVLPFMSVSFVVCIYWGQFLALFGAGTEPARWALALKDPPLPTAYLVAIVGAVTLLLAVPYAEECWRCFRAGRSLPAGGRRGSRATDLDTTPE